MAPETFWRPGLATPIGAAREWCLQAKCGPCDRVTAYRLAELADVHGARLTVSEIVSRLRCKLCQAEPTTAELVSENAGRSGHFKTVPLPI
jgi:hypothetical protein